MTIDERSFRDSAKAKKNKQEGYVAVAVAARFSNKIFFENCLPIATFCDNGQFAMHVACLYFGAHRKSNHLALFRDVIIPTSVRKNLSFFNSFFFFICFEIWTSRVSMPVKKPKGMLVQAHHVSFKAKRTVTIPFKEGALPANEYLKETERIVKVTFPDSSRIEYLGNNTWRSRLRPITFINVAATPSVELRVSFEKGALRLHSNNLFLDFTGVPESFAVTDFSFLLDGSMRATPRSAEATTVRHNCDFAGSVSLGLSTSLPAAFALIPEGIVTAVGSEILDRLIGAMEGALLQGIIRDYNIWCRMKSRKKVANPRKPVVPLRTSASS